MTLTMTMLCAALSLATVHAISIRMVYAMCVVCCGFCNTTLLLRSCTVLSRATATATAIAMVCVCAW